MLYGADLVAHGWNNTNFAASHACVLWLARAPPLPQRMCRCPPSTPLSAPDLQPSPSAPSSSQDPTFNHEAGSHKQEIEGTFQNIAAFDRAVDNLDSLRTPRCCGC